MIVGSLGVLQTAMLLAILSLVLPVAAAAVNHERPRLVWPSKDTRHLNLNAKIPAPIPNFPRSCKSYLASG